MASGTADKAKGVVKEAVGKATGDKRTEAEGGKKSHRLSRAATLWTRGMTSCAGSEPPLITVT